MLTLNEIRNVNFRKSNFGGYRAEDVEAFIDEVQLSYDSLLKENAELLKRLESLTTKLEQYQSEENSIRDALMNAQKVGDASMRDAKHKAEIILKDATIKAEKIVSNAQIEIHRERDVIEKMQRDIADFKAKLLKVYKEHLTLINSIPNEDIMRQDTRDAVASVPMLDRDTAYGAQSRLTQDDYSLGGRPTADNFGGFDRQNRFDAPDYVSSSNDFAENPSQPDFAPQGDFGASPAQQDVRPQSEQPVMPRERMNQSRGGYTINIDDDVPPANTTTLPPPMREPQGYSAFDSNNRRDRFAAPQPIQNDFGGTVVGGNDINAPFNYAQNDNMFDDSDDFSTPAFDGGIGEVNNDNSGLFRRRRG